MTHAPVELPQTSVVRGTAIVLVVAAEFRVQDSLLLLHGVMAVDAAPVRDAFERPAQALVHRLDVDRELPSSGTRTLVREPEEVEGAGFCSHPVRALQSLTPEIDEARFLRMEGQPEPCESLGKYLQYLLR